MRSKEKTLYLQYNERTMTAKKSKLLQLLNQRENDVLRLFYQELNGAEIAKELGVSSRTVELRKASICKKLGSRTMIGAVLLLHAEELGLKLNSALSDGIDGKTRAIMASNILQVVFKNDVVSASRRGDTRSVRIDSESARKRVAEDTRALTDALIEELAKQNLTP